MDTSLRPLSTAQLLDRTFQLYRRSFFLFAGIAVPAAVLSVVTKLSIWSEITGFIAGLIIPTIGEAIASGATAFAVSAVHLNKRITILESYRMLKGSFGSVLGAVGLLNLRAAGAVLAALLPCFVLGFIPLLGPFAALLLALGAYCVTYCKYALAVPACAVERLSAKQSLLRSRALTKGFVKQAVIIYVLGLVIDLLVNEILMAPQSLPPRFGLPALLTAISKAVWASLAVFLASVLAGPVSTIAFSLLYYDQRVRKEAFDLDLMINALEQNQSPTQASKQTASG